MTKPDPRNVCDGCGRMSNSGQSCTLASGGNSPTIPASICAARAWACARSSGLGRMLTLADLRPCRWNLDHQPYSWFDLFVEMEGAPPHNLAEWRSVDFPRAPR